MSYVIDSDIAVDFLRNQHSALEFLNSQEDVVITSLTLAELSFGANKSNNPSRHWQMLGNFLAGVSILPFSVEAAMKFGELKAKLVKEGKPCGDFDLAIASTCIVNDATLVTRNSRHYQQIPELKTLTL
jgi:tRNA(fMet)-specific endonuclease VapC